MDVSGETEIFAMELDDKLKDQNWFDIDNGHVATANSKGFFEDLDDVPNSHARELHQMKLLHTIVHHIPTKPHLKEGGKVKVRAIGSCSGAGDKIM